MSREMKDSGVAWIGEIPKGWEIHKGKHVLAIQKRSIRETDDVITCFRDGEVVLRSERRTQGFTFSDKEIGYQGINKGDIVIHGMDGFAGAIGISKSTGKGSPVLIVCNPFQNDNSEYLVQYLHVLAQTNVFLALATGVRERSCDLRWNKITDLPFVIPPQSEQNLIMEFLNTKCAEIDNLISLLEEMIRELKAYKQSVITEAVCKGLNKNVPMKDSGIEWIGEIPRDWEIRKVTYIYENIGSGTTPKSSNDSYYVEKGYSFLQTGDLNDGIIEKTAKYLSEKALEECSLKTYPKGSLVIAMYGATIGKLGILNIETVTNQACCVLFGKSEYDKMFGYYMFFADRTNLIMKANGGGQPNISQDIIKNDKLPVPPLTEQQTIANYLDEKCGNIEGLLAIKQAKIDELKEFKKSLIYEYVTGKKSVI